MKVISMLRCKKRSLEGAKLMAIFSIDLPGRVKNFELPRTKPLMPLFETIVNSIYAIEERQQNEDKIKGYINIEIIREPQMRVQTEGIDSSINDISSNEMKDKNGRLIKTGTNTQFYLYAVCDITSKLRKIAEDFDFIETPDKRGMYKYHDKKRAYIEILSFDKIIDDAGKRNRILFEKLGI